MKGKQGSFDGSLSAFGMVPPFQGIPVYTGVSNGMAGGAGINQGLAAASTVTASGLFIALVIQIPAVTTMVQGRGPPQKN